MRHLLACLLFAAAAGCAAAQPDPPDASWPMYRHDSWLSGRSSLKGAITTPSVISSYDLRSWDNYCIARSEAGRKTTVALQHQSMVPDYRADNAVSWGLRQPQYDLAGDGKLTSIPERQYTRYAKLLPDSKGVQKIHNDDYFGTGIPEKRKLYAYTFEPGNTEPRLLWESGPWGELEGTALTVVDADADGLPEIVGNTWGRLFVWNGQTGQQKRFLQWHAPKRDYGYFAAVKLRPEDKVPSFVVVADFVTHIDVIGNDGSELKVLWSKDVEPILSGKYKACRPLANSALDVDGDGYTEVVANLFNDTGDERWHLMIYDGTTGRVEQDVPDVYAYAAEDATGDKTPELFCSKTSGRLLPDPAPLLVGAIDGERLQWKLEVPARGMWEFTEIKQLPLNVDTMAADGRRTVRLADLDGDSRREFFVSTSQGLTAYGSDATGRLIRKCAFMGPRVSIVGVRSQQDAPGEEVLLRSAVAIDESGQLASTGASLEAVSCTPRAGAVNPPAISRLSGNKGISVLVEDALQRVLCLRPGSTAQSLAWSAPGRGITADGSSCYGVIAADVAGNSERVVIFGRSAEDGTAEVVAVRGDGKTLWSHRFPGFRGATPVWNQNGLTHWSVGRYTGRAGVDVAVSLRRSTMHTDETHLLDGRTGREIWCNPFSQTRSNNDRRGFGGALTASWDYDGDGGEDIICAYPDEYYVASGKTGQLLMGKWAGDIFPGGWLAYAVPIIGPFLDGGKPGVMWTQGGYRRGMMTPQGDKVWAFDYMDGYGPMPGLGDLNGDGKLEGLSVQNKLTTCWDAATGKVRWSFRQYQLSDAVCADINGDGRDEAIFGSGNDLLALNEVGGNPNIVWSLPLKANLGPAAIADIDEDGKAEIVVMDKNGMLHFIGPKP
ncbi:MAG: FG-GAP repeat domain-containing protein [Bacteroidota bacterium]